MPVIILYYATADCGGQFNDVNLLGIINYLNPGDRNVTFRDCPPATTPMDHEGATTYFITTGIDYYKSIVCTLRTNCEQN